MYFGRALVRPCVAEHVREVGFCVGDAGQVEGFGRPASQLGLGGEAHGQSGSAPAFHGLESCLVKLLELREELRNRLQVVFRLAFDVLPGASLCERSFPRRARSGPTPSLLFQRSYRRLGHFRCFGHVARGSGGVPLGQLLRRLCDRVGVPDHLARTCLERPQSILDAGERVQGGARS